MSLDLPSLERALRADTDRCVCSLVVPIYNDGALAQAFCAEVERNVWPQLGGRPGELIFVNDGSKNDSQAHLEAVAARYPWVTVIELSRNFGQHVAVVCGYRHAIGDTVAMLNVDMQDPPSQLPRFVALLEAGEADIVLGLRQHRQDPFLVKLTSTGFNLLLNFLSGSHVPLNSASLRVMNRRFVDAFLEFHERSPYIPGLEAWLGFRQRYLTIPHQARTQGKSSYTFRSRFRLAYNCILSFSDYPLKVMTAVGLVTTVLGLLWGAYAVWVRLETPNAQMGFASLLSAIVVFGGLNLTGLGVASLYIGRILSETQRRPAYVIRSVRTQQRCQATSSPSLNRALTNDLSLSVSHAD